MDGNVKCWEDGVKVLKADDGKFLSYYDECFTEDGLVKNCGRDACKKLMEYVYSVFKPNCGYRFGDLHEGFMNVELLKKLHKDVIS